MKKIMIDMDDVITHGYTMKFVNDFLGTNMNLEEQTDFYLQNLTGDRKEEFYEYISKRNLYGDCPMLDDCSRVLKKLNEEYELYIATSYLWNSNSKNNDSSGLNLGNKYYYLKDKLPFIKPEQYIFITNKSLLNIDIKIDDRINNLTNCETKILFSNWHNRNIPKDELDEKNIIVVNSWQEIEKLLINKKQDYSN